MPSCSLPAPMVQLRSELGDLVASIESSMPYAAVLLTSRQGLRIYVDNKQENVTEENPTAGTILTAFNGHTITEQALSGFDKDQIMHAARELSRTAQGVNGKIIDPGAQRQGDFFTQMEIDPHALTIQDKLERCRELNRRVKSLDPRLLNVRISYLERSEKSLFRNRNADLAQDVQRVYLLVAVMIAGEHGMRFNWHSKTATAGWEALHFSDDELQKLVADTVAMLDSERIEPGEYDIITSPIVSGVICHESFGHGVETDMLLKDRAKSAYYLGREVGSSLVNISDDPSFPAAFGSYFFDDEGLQASPTKIVEQGVFQRGITDLYSATALGITRSPNGRRQDFARKAYARMSNTFFERGATPVEDLFLQVEDGVYLERWNSGMEDPKGWGIQVTCLYGREIKGGKFSGRIFAPIVLTGYVPDVLHSITAVGDEWELSGGTCGKGHKEYVPTASGGPHLLLRARLG